MLSYDEIADLSAALCATAETVGQTLSATAAELMAEDLAEYPMDVITNALWACRRELKGRFTLKAVIDMIDSTDGRPGKDEAWAIALASSDELDTSVMTDEIQLALGAARSVLDAGDKVGARMAFISAYERFVADARRQVLPVNWHLSIGFDPNRRIEAVNTAVQMHRIPLEHGQKYLADLTHEPITEDGKAIAGLITGDVCKPSAEVHKRLQVIRETLAQGAEKKRRQARLERVELYLRKRKLQAQVMALLEKRDA